jgi:hypothetical protein
MGRYLYIGIGRKFIHRGAASKLFPQVNDDTRQRMGAFQRHRTVYAS